MATTPVNPTQQSGDAVAPELQEMFEKLKSYVTTQATPTTPPTPEPEAIPQPLAAPQFSMKIGDQIVTAASQDELERQVNQILGQYQRSVQSQQIQQTTQPPAAPAPVDQYAMSEDQKIEFARLLVDNPAKAFNYIDKLRYGWDEPTEVIKSVAQDTYQLQAVMAGQQFMVMNNDFVMDPRNAQAIDHILKQNQWVGNTNNLNAAWALAKQNGWAVTRQQAQPQPPPQAQPVAQVPHPVQQVPAPPPMVPRSSGFENQNADIIDQFESLPVDQMRALIQKLYGS